MSQEDVPLILCNLVGRGLTVTEAREKLGLNSPPADVTSAGSGPTGETPVGGEPSAPTAPPAPPVDPQTSGTPSWMPNPGEGV